MSVSPVSSSETSCSETSYSESESHEPDGSLRSLRGPGALKGSYGTLPDLSHVERVDIGCGRPTEKYADCFGLDINPGYEPDLLWSCDRGLPFKDQSLSFVNTDNSLEHLKHPYFVLEECFRCLRPGGELRVVVPNLHYFPTLLLALFFDVDRYFDWYMNLPHKEGRTHHRTLFTKHTVRRTAKEIGFEVVRDWGFLYSKEVGFLLRKPGPDSDARGSS